MLRGWCFLSVYTLLLCVRVCKIESVDGSNISAYYVHECDAVNRTGLRSRRFIFTGHTNGSVQVGGRVRWADRWVAGRGGIGRWRMHPPPLGGGELNHSKGAPPRDEVV